MQSAADPKNLMHVDPDKARIIDPTKLKDGEDGLLIKILEQLHKQKIKIIEKNKLYSVMLPSDSAGTAPMLVKVILTHDLFYSAHLQIPTLKQQSNRRKRPTYWVIDADMTSAFAKGKYGSIYPVLGVIVPRCDGSIQYKTHKKRIIKIQYHDSAQKKFQLAKNEANLLRLFPDYHTKKIRFLKNNNAVVLASYILTKRFPGKSLDVLMQADIDGTCKISLEKRLQLSIQLLCQLQHLHEHIVHRDLKPENIMVDLAQCQVKIVDFGLSRHKAVKDSHIWGNLGYFAPEAFSKKYPYDDRSDRYSLGLILAELWGARPRDYNAAHKPSFVLERLEHEIELADLSSLFLNTPELTEQHKFFIRQLLNQILSLNPDHRPCFDAAIKTFTTVWLEQRKAAIAPTFHLPVDYAHQLALRVRDKLSKLTKQTDKDILKKMITIFMDAFKESSEQPFVVDHPEVIKEFVAILNINELTGLKSMAAVCSRAREIIQEYETNYEDLQTLSAQICATNDASVQHLQLIEDVQDALFKYEKYHTNFFMLADLNARMRNEVLRLKKAGPDVSVVIHNEHIAKPDDLFQQEVPPNSAFSCSAGLINSGQRFFQSIKLCVQPVKLIDSYLGQREGEHDELLRRQVKQELCC